MAECLCSLLGQQMGSFALKLKLMSLWIFTLNDLFHCWSTGKRCNDRSLADSLLLYDLLTLSVTSEEHGRRVISILSMESKHSVTRDKMNLETNRHSQDKTSKEYDHEFK